jgi:hypothetical protein
MNFRAHLAIAEGTVGFNASHRRLLQISLNETVELLPFIPQLESNYIYSITLGIKFLSKNRIVVEDFPLTEIKRILHEYSNQFFTTNQKLVVKCMSHNLELHVVKIVRVSDLISRNEVPKSGNFLKFGFLIFTLARGGILHSNTIITLVKAPGSTIYLESDECVILSN